LERKKKKYSGKKQHKFGTCGKTLFNSKWVLLGTKRGIKTAEKGKQGNAEKENCSQQPPSLKVQLQGMYTVSSKMGE